MVRGADTCWKMFLKTMQISSDTLNTEEMGTEDLRPSLARIVYAAYWGPNNKTSILQKKINAKLMMTKHASFPIFCRLRVSCNFQC